jgi:hypothetical protein
MVIIAPPRSPRRGNAMATELKEAAQVWVNARCQARLESELAGEEQARPKSRLHVGKAVVAGSRVGTQSLHILIPQIMLMLAFDIGPVLLVPILLGFSFNLQLLLNALYNLFILIN